MTIASDYERLVRLCSPWAGSSAGRERAQRRALTGWPEQEIAPLPSQAPNAMPGFSLYAPPRRRGVDDGARARNVDAVLTALGVRPRR